MLAMLLLPRRSQVTSFTLVWIKMFLGVLLCRRARLSRASRSCGLKFPIRPPQNSCVSVTSFTLVWIKIQQNQRLRERRKSRASRSCGLKLWPVRGRAGGWAVTSFTLVWIKIATRRKSKLLKNVTSFTLVWIKIQKRNAHPHSEARHELHARVD